MRSVFPMKAAKIGYIVVSSLLCVLGILLMIFPELSAEAIGVISGIMLLVFGAVKLVGYFSKDLYRLAFQYDLAFGILLIALGVMILIRPESLMAFICITLGLYILADGLFKIQIAAQAKRFGIRVWWLILIFAVAAAICGLVLMLRPGAGSRLLMVLLGLSLLSEGILNLGTVITAVKIIKNQQPDIIEGECSEHGSDDDF